jgi:hypothetical protein
MVHAQARSIRQHESTAFYRGADKGITLDQEIPIEVDIVDERR